MSGQIIRLGFGTSFTLRGRASRLRPRSRPHRYRGRLHGRLRCHERRASTASSTACFGCCRVFSSSYAGSSTTPHTLRESDGSLGCPIFESPSRIIYPSRLGFQCWAYVARQQDGTDARHVGVSADVPGAFLLDLPEDANTAMPVCFGVRRQSGASNSGQIGS